LIALPWLTLFADRLTRSGDALAYTALFPITALAARAFADLELSAGARLAVFSCAGGALLAGLIFLVDRLADRSAWQRYGLLLFIAPLIYGFGAAGEIDALLDASAANFAAPILSRDYYIGRHSTFDVVLGPWGNRLLSNQNSVSWNAYLALRRESVACIDGGPGALGMEWHKISACEEGTASKR
jgi:hypothetical protein